MSKAFNPFGKYIYDIKPEDIAILKNISEGIYIEYKKQEIKVDKISKELASFANQFGGWIIWGVEESSETKYPKSFTGLTDDEFRSLSQKINEASQARLSREVIYHEVKIKGPIQEVGLSEGKSLLITYIPFSHNTPHINKDGRVYVRLGEQAQPKGITDVSLLNSLYQRNENLFSSIDTQIKSYKTLLKGDWEKLTYIDIFVTVDFEKVGPETTLSYNKFKELINSETEIPLDNIHPLKGGFFAKQKEKDNPLSPSLSFRWFHHNSCMMSIPLNLHSPDELLRKGYDKAQYLSKHTGVLNNFYPHFLDLNYLLLVIVSFFKRLLKILGHIGYKDDLLSVFHIRNLHNKIPFINTDSYQQQIESSGLPILPIEDVPFPSIRSKDDFITLQSSDELQRESIPNIKVGLPLLQYIYEDLGLELPRNNESYGKLLLQLLDGWGNK